jgi:16S rRNA (cytosine967-C5)-methyltransferase
MDKDRKLAYLALKETENGSWSNMAISKLFSKESADAPAFVRELVYGALRNQLLLDFNIDYYLKKPSISIAARIILRLGFYQLLFMDSVPDYAAADSSTELAARFAASQKGLVNGVLRSYIRDGKKLRLPTLLESPEAAENVPSGKAAAESAKSRAAAKYHDRLIRRLSVEYSVRPWIAELWLSSYGREQAEALLGASVTPAPLVIRANVLKNSREELAERLSAIGFETSPLEDVPAGLKAKGSGLLDTELFRKGNFSVQGEASQLAVSLLDPKPGQRVIDLCAAPGGKSCAMAEALGGEGQVLAFDIYPERVRLIEAQARRLDIGIIRAEAGDASVFRPELSESADRVLADVPCSGLGTLRQKPEIKLKEEPEGLEQLPGLQQKILENAAGCLKKGGQLLYSTCTVNPAENCENVRRFLEGRRGFELVCEKQLFTEKDGPDGFYMALIKRIG